MVILFNEKVLTKKSLGRLKAQPSSYIAPLFAASNLRDYPIQNTHLNYRKESGTDATFSE